jgi:SAM-dependent methyltransferase
VKLFGYTKWHYGYCPICKQPALFASRQDWLRDHYRCLRCKSIPRFRAIIEVLETHFPDWRAYTIHESSPGGASSNMLARQCANLIASHYFPDVPSGETRDGFRCENLEGQTFEDQKFDLVVTQDVFEHVVHPDRAFREIARTLKPGGAHVFTVPWYYWKKTIVRAQEQNGEMLHLLPPEYHGNPINKSGSLVMREWGFDLADFILQSSGLVTTAIRIHDPWKGIEAKFMEVFISIKPN